MSSQSSQSSSSSSGDSSPASSDQLTLNLQVVSPSVGVNRPLRFPEIAASTTIKQLKERIRQILPLRPADDHQRLIHRGRALVRETDTMLDIFGEDAVSLVLAWLNHVDLLTSPLDSFERAADDAFSGQGTAQHSAPDDHKYRDGSEPSTGRTNGQHSTTDSCTNALWAAASSRLSSEESYPTYDRGLPTAWPSPVSSACQPKPRCCRCFPAATPEYVPLAHSPAEGGHDQSDGQPEPTE